MDLPATAIADHLPPDGSGAARVRGMLAEAARLRWRGRAIAWLLAAWIAGTALQILQPALWPAAAYWALGGVGVAAAAVGAALAYHAICNWGGKVTGRPSSVARSTSKRKR